MRLSICLTLEISTSALLQSLSSDVFSRRWATPNYTPNRSKTHHNDLTQCTGISSTPPVRPIWISENEVETRLKKSIVYLSEPTEKDVFSSLGQHPTFPQSFRNPSQWPPKNIISGRTTTQQITSAIFDDLREHRSQYSFVIRKTSAAGTRHPKVSGFIVWTALARVSSSLVLAPSSHRCKAKFL